MTFKLAVINESECIGCTKCLQFCPFDAIVGANKQIHTVLENHCTGCELCVAPCPVDCIDIITVDKMLYDPEKIKIRKKARKIRLDNHFAQAPTDSQDITKTLQAAINRINK